MASSSHNSKAQAQVTTPPDSPHQETPSSETKIQLYTNAIHGLLAGKKRGISPTGRSQSDELERSFKSTEDGKSLAETLNMAHPLDNVSEFLTVDQLSGLLEAALAARGSPSPSGIGHASLEQGSDNTTHGKYLPPCDVLNG